MLRIIPSGSAADAQRYYAQGLAREDYYSQGQEVAGKWHGYGAEMLEVLGKEVSAENFAALTECRHPLTGERLTPRMDVKRIAGYDHNFHAPKSLSILHALRGDTAIVDAFQDAVAETMAEIEMMAATRIRKGGAQDDRVTSNLIWAPFVHFTSRPVGGVPDPHLHMHCFVMNVTFDHVEERWKAAKFHDIKSEAPQFEAAFHARLAAKVAALGYPVRRSPGRWEIEGISREMIRKYSRRTEEIEALAIAMGISDPKQKDALGAKTRKGKTKGLSAEQLLDKWMKRLTPAEIEILDRVASKKGAGSIRPKVTPQEALDFAELKCFERNSVVKRGELITQALRFGVGSVLPGDVEREIARRGIIEAYVDGQLLCTTTAVMLEEAALIDRVRDGRGKLAPLIPSKIRFQRDFLSREQREAVRHILQSNDQYVAIRGVAGAGKTTAMQEVREQLALAGHRVFAFASSADASRGVLREAGFSDADTIAKLLVDKGLQQKVRGKVVLIDESGLVGVREMARISEIVGESTKVILVGDTAQHAPVARGDNMRLLEKYSGIPVASIRQIRRQEKQSHREAIKALSDGDVALGFSILDGIGAVEEETNDGLRYRMLAEEYFRCLDDTGKAPLVVSPTHAEGREVTAAIRAQLAERGVLGDEKTVIQYRDLKWVEADRMLAENYSEGLMVQFHQNVPGITRGAMLPVHEVDEGRGTVSLKLENGKVVSLDLSKAARFQVFEQREMQIAEGDVIRISKGGQDLNGRRLNNGTMLTVNRFAADGSIETRNGVVLAVDHGHLQHGYCGTSHSSQGKTVDEVFVAQSASSGLAASKEGFYVSCSRGKQNIRIFTDDRDGLLQAIRSSSTRISGIELAGAGKGVFMTPGMDGTEWVKRIAQEKARHHHPGTHVDKILAARRMDPAQAKTQSFQSYIEMRRANVESDGKSRSLGSGPSTQKKGREPINDPRGNSREKSAEKQPQKSEVKPETRMGRKVREVTSNLKKSLSKDRTENSDTARKSLTIGNLKVKVADLTGKVASKIQERRERSKERESLPPKKAQSLEQKPPVKAPVKAPPVAPGRRR